VEDDIRITGSGRQRIRIIQRALHKGRRRLGEQTLEFRTTARETDNLVASGRQGPNQM
jgi:hypothetical protein